MLTFREDAPVTKAVEDAREKWRRFEDAWDLTIWILCRDPTAGSPVTESGATRVFVLEGARSIELPTVILLYHYDSQYVTGRDVQFMDAKYGQAGQA